MAKRSDNFPEEEKSELRARINARISDFCNFAALIIILISIASFILGNSNEFYETLGVMISIALIAIAAISSPTRKR